MSGLLIKSGAIIDGVGKDRVLGDIFIEAGDIREISIPPGRISPTANVINAQGLVVAPGFVDILSHADAYLTLLRISSAESLLRQGITTILGGNCGASLAPLVDRGQMTSIQKWGDIREMNVNWERFGEFLDVVEQRTLGVNFASLVGHATLRRGLLKDEVRPITEEEKDKMRYLLEQAMTEGAFGLSFAPAYSHARQASKEELVPLAKIVGQNNGLFSVHLRNEGPDILLALKEAMDIARDASVSLELSHLKIVGRRFWDLWTGVMEAIDRAGEKKLDVHFDVYPYTRNAQVLYTLLPWWAAEGGREKMLERLHDQTMREKIVAEMKKQPYDYDTVVVAIAHRDPTFSGRSLSQIAHNEGVSKEEAVLNLLQANEGRVICFMETTSTENLRAALAHPRSFVTTAGAGYDLLWAQKGELVHPRTFGALPRFLGRFVREGNILPLEEAVAKISSGPAKKIGLKDRGTLKKGNKADIVIFDAQKIKDHADFTDPYQYSTGIQWVIVNGEVAVNPSGYTGALAGKVLRR